MSILVFGHKNPDTDTICSAVAYAELKGKLAQISYLLKIISPKLSTKYRFPSSAPHSLFPVPWVIPFSSIANHGA